MSRFLVILAALLLGTAGASAQDAPLINVYTCYSDGECSHAVTSQEWTAEEAELVIGDPAPSPDASIVCLEGGSCTWTELSESDIEITNGGDGIIESVEVIDLDGYPAELLDFDFEDTAGPSEYTDDGRVWVVMCSGETCRAARSKITKSEAEIILGEEMPEGDAYVLCDAGGCRRQIWDEAIQPLDGLWFLETRTPQARNCPVSGLPLDTLVRAGERSISFSKPVKAVDVFAADTGNFDVVRQATPSQNSYVLSLDVGSGQFGSRVIYDWTVVTEAFVVGGVVIDLPSIYGGRCVIYIPWEMHHAG